MWILVLLISLAAVGTAVAIDARYRARRDADDAYDAVTARLAAAGELPATGTVYTSAAAVPPDVRLAEIAADPELTEADVVTAVKHVAPGVGSLASFAAVAYDTAQMRTGAERHEIDAVYDAAHDEDVRRDLDLAFAEAAESSRDTWAAIDAWVERYHGKTHYASCVHCAETLHVHSDEYAQIVHRVESEHTGEISRAALFAGV
jgi:hypothetical protein